MAIRNILPQISVAYEKLNNKNSAIPMTRVEDICVAMLKVAIAYFHAE
jgi:hypothetical protein